MVEVSKKVVVYAASLKSPIRGDAGELKSVVKRGFTPSILIISISTLLHWSDVHVSTCVAAMLRCKIRPWGVSQPDCYADAGSGNQCCPLIGCFISVHKGDWYDLLSLLVP